MVSSSKRQYAESRQISVRLRKEQFEFLEREAMRLTARPPYMDISTSDVVRLAIMHYRDTSAAVPFARRKCDVVEADGQRICVACNLRWDTGEASSPDCPHPGSDDQ